MKSLTRRTLLEGIGSAVVAAFAPQQVLAALPRPMQGLEEMLGGARIDRVRFIWGRPRWSWITAAELMDEGGRFRMSEAWRHGLMAIVNGCPAAEIIQDKHSEEAAAKQTAIDASVVDIFSCFGLLPPELGWGVVFDEDGAVVRNRFAVGKAWQALGWSEPESIVQERSRPDPEWMMTGKANPESGFHLKVMSWNMGWTDDNPWETLE
jgi:hypothetical protein